MKEERNPLQWLYLKVTSGDYINLAILSRKVERYMKQEEIKTINSLLKASNSIAISANALKEGTRRKYKEKRIRIGQKHYYLFNKEWQPADIIIKLDPELYIYETLNGN